jgi:agarase
MYQHPQLLRILRTLVIASLPLAFVAGCGGGGGGGDTPPPPPTADTTPDAFSFPAISGAARGVFVESAATTITGINAAASVSISGGEYSIAGGAFTSGSSSVTNGQAIVVRVTTAADFDTQTSATLTVGGVLGDFSVTTLAAPQVLVDVNVNVRHSVGGVDYFDRPKFITVHSSPSDHDWFGNNAQSRYEPNALPDLMQDFLGGKDVYLGRNTGGITWYLGEMAEDGARPGFVDETDATNTGNSVRSNYSNNMDDRWVSTRLHDDRAVNMVVGAQQHPFWPDGTPTRQGWALSQTDTPAEPLGTATGHWMGQYMSKFFRPAGSVADGQVKPPLVEVMNEPVWELHDAATPPEPLDRIFEFHNAVAAEIRATNNDVLIGGYTAAFPNFEEDDFDRWRNRDKLFLDLAGANMDFVSIHLYDFAAINDGTGIKNKYRKGSNLEATIDMLDHYNTLLFGSPKPLVVSEYGGRAHIMENQPWTPERDGVMLRSANSMLMAFLERPDNILMTSPFIVIKAEWGRTTVPYNWRLMRQRFEADGETGDEWVYTELVRLYELWVDVAGTRVDSFATDPDILVDAYVDGADLYVIVNNLEFDETTFDLDLGGLGGANVLSVDMRHLHTVNNDPVLDLSSVTTLPDVMTLGGEATMVIRVELDAVVTTAESSTETKHYASSMLQPIGASTTLSFDVEGVTPGAHGEAILRLGVGRAHGLSLTPSVSVNGTAVTVSSDYRGYDQYHNGNGRDAFFGVLEIPVPWSAIQGNNQVDVTFPDTGGHISSVALQTFNHSSTIVRRTQ